MIKPSVLSIYAATMLLATSALAGEKVFKYDQFSEDPDIAKNEIPNVQVACQPGFAKTEAYGILVVPAPDDYPFDILRVEFLQGDSLNDPNSDKVNKVTVQIYNDDTTDAAPVGAPVFEISSQDIVDPMTLMPQHVQEGVFMQYKFDPMGDPASHPKKIVSGNLRVMIQFDDQDMVFPSIPGCDGVSGYGCQDPCALADPSGTPGGNLIRAVGNKWFFNEDVGQKGDWIFRVVINSSATGAGGGGAGGNTGSSSSSSSSGSGGGGMGVQCDTDADCPNVNEVCRAHICQLDAECKSDADCPSVDQVCRANKCQTTDTGGCGCETLEPKAGGSAAMVLLAGAGMLLRRRASRGPARARRAAPESAPRGCVSSAPRRELYCYKQDNTNDGL